MFTVDATAATGHPALSSEEIADQAAEHADILIPFGDESVDAGDRGLSGVRSSRTTRHGCWV
ncbi:hypothetical protein [Streptomyces violaceusniger]|uniref:hypothetical protein n=1 Tax=Streptomyces violaceusniger TaxID=68280 RepID=UPI0036A2C1EC